MHDNTYYDEQTLYKFFMTLTKTKGVGPEIAERIITEIQNNGFLIRERPNDGMTPKPKTYRRASVEPSTFEQPPTFEEKPPTIEKQQPLRPEFYLDR